MDDRAAKLALARKKLKDHQDKKNQENIQMGSNEPNDGDQNANIINNKCLVTQVNKVSSHSSEITQKQNVQQSEAEINATEYLISNKINLELQITDLQAKNTELETNLIATKNKYELTVQKLNALEHELKNMHLNYNSATEQLLLKDNVIKELNETKALNLEEKNNLKEQLEFAKAILSAKETENDSLHSQLYSIQSQLDSTQLQLEQLTSGAHISDHKQTQQTLTQENHMLLQKVSNLEQQLKSQLKDYQQINSHYEHYVGELNEQLKSITRKNEELNRELQNLSNRENNLIEQISEMEIRLQNYNRMITENMSNTSYADNEHCNKNEIKILQDKYDNLQANFQQLCSNYEEVQKLLGESNAKIKELSHSKDMDCNPTNQVQVSLVKLNADITSDKVAAQRATEQNKKLKHDLQGLEETVVKMTTDKLELTEKLTAEKYLNRELTIKLAEIDEKANNLQIALKAKDEEMIRLQATYRLLERNYEELNQKYSNLQDNLNKNGHEDPLEEQMKTENECENSTLIVCSKDNNSICIPTGNAMFKLQERFLKIMEEVADLSDEKHRLEHIIMQLQNETDTICEYVALYQQQRSLLKKRDEERSAQIKIYKTECSRLQNQLDELTGILKRFAEDKDLSSYFQIQTKHEDIQKVMGLLSNMKTSSLLDPHKTMELNKFYPCSCCSGQLIDV